MFFCLLREKYNEILFQFIDGVQGIYPSIISPCHPANEYILNVRNLISIPSINSSPGVKQPECLWCTMHLDSDCREPSIPWLLCILKGSADKRLVRDQETSFLKPVRSMSFDLQGLLMSSDSFYTTGLNVLGSSVGFGGVRAYSICQRFITFH